MVPQLTTSMQTESDSSMEGKLKVVVIGDPHFFVEPPGGGWSPSHIKLNADGSFRENHPTTNPWVGLMDIVKRQALKADILICVGDITTHANAQALRSAWKWLQELGALLDVQHIACATGNHDVASRSDAKAVAANPVRQMSAAVGAFEGLKLLDPPYPIVEQSPLGIVKRRDLRTQYFGDALVLLETPTYRLLVLNSCSEHSTEPYQNERGSFPRSASEALNHALANLNGEDKINLLVCHHPPQIHSEHGAGGHDQIENGEELLRALESQGSWLVIHGHKHHGRILRASGGGSDAPIIFAAASLGAYLDVSQPGIKNQFYSLEVECSGVGGVRGVVTSWDWYCGSGWSKSPPKNGGIFDGCGFGLTAEVRTVASNIDAGLISSSCPWSQVMASHPDLRFANPRQLELLANQLEKRHNIIVDRDDDGRWTELVRARNEQ